MKCAACDSSDNLVWAHNGGHDTHRWDDATERDCRCGPSPLCLHCDAAFLREYGFVVLDAACFQQQTTTMQ